MIFDDHDVHDDWNTSIEWVTEMRQKDWWRRRIVAAFESYLIYQHLGNLSPAERARASSSTSSCGAGEDPTAAAARLRQAGRRGGPGHALELLPRHRARARVVMIDSRAGRVLDPGRRAMVDGGRVALDRASMRRGDVDHLLIGTSLPLIMGPAMHWLEAWNEVTADGAWGQPVKKLAEKLREALDLEHWPAWQDSFRAHVRAAARRRAPGARGAAPRRSACCRATSTTPTWPRSASRRGAA